MSEDFTPPPRRPAPDELRERVRAELDHAQNRTSRRGRVLAPVAAALVLVAGVGGVLGAGRLDSHQDLVPVERPSSSPSRGAAPSPTASPSPTPRATAAPRAESLAVEPMTKAQIRRDTESCLRADPGDQPPPRQGDLRTRYAAVQPVITSDAASTATQRVLFLEDDLGQYQCIDGSQNGWSSGTSDGYQPTAEVPGRQVPNTGGGTSAVCGKVAESAVESDVLLEVDEERVATAHVTLLSDGRPVRVVDVPVRGSTVYAAVQLSGAAARLPMSFRVELHDRKGRVLGIQPYGPSGTKPARSLVFRLQSCADIEERRLQNQPKPVRRPTSDAAGVATCLRMIKKTDEPFDRDRAKAEVMISTPSEWGTVLSDGSHYLGCSLYPTAELQSAAQVTDGRTLDEEQFHWALNPVVPEGESLWAAGHLPGATRISYALPDGSTASARISSDGYWMIKARTDSAFDREDDTDDWKPVRVTVTRAGHTTSYTIAWNETTMCNQISHGC